MAVPAGTSNPDSKRDIVKSSGNQNGKEKDGDRDDEEPISKFDELCERFDINPNLLMLKVTLFFLYGGTSCLLPYLTIHMQSIGLTVEEIAIVYLALPLTTFLSPPLTGYLVDKMGHYKPVMVLTLVLNAAFHHALLLIPPMETPGITPPAFVMRDPASGKVGVWWSPCRSRDCPDDEGAVKMVLDDCFDHCKLWEPQPTPPRKSILTALHKGIAFRPPTFLAEKPSPEEEMKIPGPGGPNDDLQFKRRPFGKKKTKNGTALVKTTTPPPNTTEQHTMLIQVDLYPQPESDEEDQDPPDVFTSVFNQSILEENGINFTALEGEDLRCGGNMQATNVTYKTLTVITEDCLLQRCTFRVGGPEQCPPDFKESDDRIFWIYFVLRFVATIMLCGGVTLMDPIALSLIEEHGGEFGRERLSSNIGQAIFSPLTGLLIDYYSQRAGYTDYSSAFYAYDILLLISALTILTMPKVNNPPSDNLLTDLMKLIRLPHVIAFIFFLFILGNFWGFIESYLFIYLKDLDSPNWLLGFTVTVGTLTSIPFLWGAGRITKRFGHVNIVVLAFFSHAVRLMGYSFTDNALWCFPFEAIESLSVHLMWVAAATYCTLLAPKSLLATLIGVLGMAHFSLGRGSGSFFGGLIVSEVGPRQAFRVMGIIAAISGICYGVLQKLWLSKVAAKHAEKNKEEDADPEAVRLNGDGNAEPTITAEQLKRASMERLTLMIQFNQRGSLTSLNRGSSIDLRPRDRRRSSGNFRAGSTSRVDLRKSTLEMRRQEARGSTPVLSTTLTPKGVTSPVNRKNQRIPSINALSVTASRSRDSIREEAEEHTEDLENTGPRPSTLLQSADKDI